MRTPDLIPPRHDPLLGIHMVMQLSGLSKGSLYRLMNKRHFPQSVQLTREGTRVAWRESEVLAWAANPLEWGDVEAI